MPCSNSDQKPHSTEPSWFLLSAALFGLESYDHISNILLTWSCASCSRCLVRSSRTSSISFRIRSASADSVLAIEILARPPEKVCPADHCIFVSIFDWMRRESHIVKGGTMVSLRSLKCAGGGRKLQYHPLDNRGGPGSALVCAQTPSCPNKLL